MKVLVNIDGIISFETFSPQDFRLLRLETYKFGLISLSMFLEILFAILLGVLAGCFTGLIPGIHTNLVAVFLVSLSSFFLDFVSVVHISVFIVSMSVTHSFVASIPSIFLGAPESAFVLNVLPGHKMLLEGEGLNAVKFTVLGSLLGLVICFFLFNVFKFVIEFSYDFLSSYIAELLFLVGLFLIFRASSKLRALVIYLSAGALGYFTLNSRVEEPLFALLSGLFGVSILIYSLFQKTSFPSQKETRFSSKLPLSSVGLGTLSGFITCILPGLGSSTAAAISSLFKSESSPRDFLVLTGSISTVNFFMSLAALEVIERARNGSIVAVMNLWEAPSIEILVATCLISGGFAVFATNFLGKKFSLLITKIDYVKIVKVVISLIVFLTIALSGLKGLFVLLVGSTIGIYANWRELPRNLMMSCIMVPVMIFFI